MIIELKSYANEKGHLIQERIVVSDNNGVKFDRFLGKVMIGINTPAGPQMEEMEFPIPAESLEAAFNVFEQYAKMMLDKIKREHQKQVAVPQKSGLILPG